jgi:hypothetical protein
MTPRTPLLLSALAGLLLLASCQEPALTPPPGARSSPVIEGKPSGEDQNHTVFIRTLPNGIATGVLIAPNLVLTALHVATIYDVSASSFVCVPGKQVIDVYSARPPESLLIFPGNKFPGPNAQPPAAVKKVIPLPTVDICKGDLAFLLLDKDLPDLPIAPMRLDGPPLANEDVFAVGWGAFNTDGSFPKTRQTRDGIKVLATGPGQYQRPGGLTIYELYEGHAVTSPGTCLGDSGSGMFSQQGALLGILSSGDSDDPNSVPTKDEPVKFCETSTVFYTRLDVFKDKILDVFKETGHRPWLEGKKRPGVFGDVCAAEDECDQGPCVSGVCSRSCEAEPCPEGFDCAGDAGSKVCSPINSGAGGGAGAGGSEAGAGGSGEAGSDAGNGGDAGQPASSGNPQGSSCTLASECTSGLCVSLESGAVCSARCEQTPCENGWECSPQGDRKICLPPAQIAPSEAGCAAAPLPRSPAVLPGLALALALLARRRRSVR